MNAGSWPNSDLRRRPLSRRYWGHSGNQNGGNLQGLLLNARVCAGASVLTGGCGPTEQTGEVRIAPFFCGERFPFRDLTPYVAGTDPERLPVCALGFKTRETVHGEREISDHAESGA